MEILRLKQVMRSKAITGKALADGLGISKGYISEIVQHKKTPSIETLEQIAKFLDVDIRDLFNPTKEGSSNVYTDENTGKRIRITEL